MKYSVLVLSFVFMVFMIISCGKQEPTAPVTSQSETTSLAKSGNSIDTAIQDMMDGVNAQLAADGKDYVLGVVEYMDSGDEVGRTVYFRGLGNRQLSHHFVPYDPNRGSRRDITWINDITDGATASGLSSSQTSSAIRSAMQTWQGVICSTLPLTDMGDFAGFDLGYVQYLLGYGGVGGWVADLTHGGFLPRGFFDALAPGGGDFILGVTFTFVWTGTDMDNNRKSDTAFREIYYNDNFSWANGATYDVETVALHEAGHGLSQAHFGTAFRDPGSGKLHFAPRAVMNAAYSGVQTEIEQTDNAGHCSIWASWPNN